VAQRVLRVAGHRRDLDAACMRALDQFGRRRAQRVDDQLDRVLQRDLDHRALSSGVKVNWFTIAFMIAFGIGLRQRGTPARRAGSSNESQVLAGEQALGVELAVARAS
jgi:hypothetical protein